MGRSIFAETDGIVGVDVDHRDFHDRGEADCRAHVVAEVEERTTEGTNFRQGYAVQGGAHAVLTDTEVKIASGIAARLEVAGAVELQCGFVGSRKVGGAADEPR